MTDTLHRYGNGSRARGVTHYGLLPNALLLLFQNGSAYLYTAALTGAAHVQRMRQLAADGSGLSTYISRHVDLRYAAKLTAAEVETLMAHVLTQAANREPAA